MGASGTVRLACRRVIAVDETRTNPRDGRGLAGRDGSGEVAAGSPSGRP